MKRIIPYLVVVLVTLGASYLIFHSESVDLVGYKTDTFWGNSSKRAHLLLNRILSSESHVAWGAGNHTASPVPCGAIGPKKYTDQLDGIFPNTKIADVTQQAVKDGMNVILVVGDGMGFGHMSLPIYMHIAKKEGETNFERIMNEGAAGIALTNPANGIVTGSAAAGTALATGHKTLINMIATDTNGYAIQSTLALAEKLGHPTGLVTDAGITDATPSVFYAHSINRNWENKIAAQLIDNNDIEVIFGGGAARFIPQNTYLKDNEYFKNSSQFDDAKSDRPDDRNLIKDFADKGYTVISNKNQLADLSKDCNKVVGLFAPGGITAAVDRDEEPTDEPSVLAMATKAVQILDSKKNSFFVMIEAGRIDWEAHDNDAGAVYKATDEMDKILGMCYDEYKKDPEHTLVVFTADHETGDLGIAYTKYDKDHLEHRTLKDGELWESDTNPLSFDDYKKLGQQKKSIYRILSGASSKEELYQALKEDLPYDVKREDSDKLFEVLDDYRKGK